MLKHMRETLAAVPGEVRLVTDVLRYKHLIQVAVRDEIDNEVSAASVIGQVDRRRERVVAGFLAEEVEFDEAAAGGEVEYRRRLGEGALDATRTRRSTSCAG